MDTTPFARRIMRSCTPAAASLPSLGPIEASDASSARNVSASCASSASVLRSLALFAATCAGTWALIAVEKDAMTSLAAATATPASVSSSSKAKTASRSCSCTAASKSASAVAGNLSSVSASSRFASLLRFLAHSSWRVARNAPCFASRLRRVCRHLSWIETAFSTLLMICSFSKSVVTWSALGSEGGSMSSLDRNSPSNDFSCPSTPLIFSVLASRAADLHCRISLLACSSACEIDANPMLFALRLASSSEHTPLCNWSNAASNSDGTETGSASALLWKSRTDLSVLSSTQALDLASRTCARRSERRREMSKIVDSIEVSARTFWMNPSSSKARSWAMDDGSDWGQLSMRVLKMLTRAFVLASSCSRCSALRAMTRARCCSIVFWNALASLCTRPSLSCPRLCRSSTSALTPASRARLNSVSRCWAGWQGKLERVSDVAWSAFCIRFCTSARWRTAMISAPCNLNLSR
mmetsp:Transcript_66483/g.157560  ORF Transcript_66483/g.157560 Transcript_66483/m.157560 type:complete len:469 (-) Transcript_66483:2956-4362(-)